MRTGADGQVPGGGAPAMMEAGGRRKSFDGVGGRLAGGWVVEGVAGNGGHRGGRGRRRPQSTSHVKDGCSGQWLDTPTD